MVQANIGKDSSGRIVVSFPWHPAEKHWSFPNTDSILGKILKVFGDKEVQIDPALQANLRSLSATTLPNLGAKLYLGAIRNQLNDHCGRERGITANGRK
jgi:hypothetical protein